MLRHAEVHGLRMAYRETGSGPPIVFLHGNPTSSYLWRNILGPLAHHGRCVAPDLVGIGASDPLPDSGPGRYRFIDHREYLDELLMTIGVDREVVIVGHDWGAVLGIDWAAAIRTTCAASPTWRPSSHRSPGTGRTRPTPSSSGRCAPRRASGSSCATMCSSRRSYLRAPDAPSPSTRGPPIGPPTCSPASRGVPR